MGCKRGRMSTSKRVSTFELERDLCWIITNNTGAGSLLFVAVPRSRMEGRDNKYRLGKERVENAASCFLRSPMSAGASVSSCASAISALLSTDYKGINQASYQRGETN